MSLRGCSSGFGAGKWSNDIHYFNNRSKIKQIPNSTDLMRRISTWKSAVVGKNALGPLYHEFVVVRTNNSWWSVDKECQGIIVSTGQWSDILYYYMYRRQPRKGKVNQQKSWRKVKSDSNITTLIDWLKTEEVPRGYGMWTNNCLDFAQRVYRRFAA